MLFGSDCNDKKLRNVTGAKRGDTVGLEDASIPPTNNSSEQAIRMSTVFRKVTHGFRSDWGRDLFAAVRSVVNTGKRQGLSAYQAIQKALSPVRSLFEPG